MLKGVSQLYHVLVARVYDFLEMHGRINVGVFHVARWTNKKEASMVLALPRSVCDVTAGPPVTVVVPESSGSIDSGGDMGDGGDNADRNDSGDDEEDKILA